MFYCIYLEFNIPPPLNDMNNEIKDIHFKSCVDISQLHIENPKTTPSDVVNEFSDLGRRTYANMEDLYWLESKLCNLRALRHHTILYRGHADSSFELLPSIVRNGCPYDRESERKSIQQLKAYSEVPLKMFHRKQFDETLFYMAAGRHLGLRSRLLDWSKGLWQALSFTVSDKEMERDGCLWILSKTGHPALEDADPFKIKDGEVRFYEQHFYSTDDRPIGTYCESLYRRFKQSGVFSTCGDDIIRIPLNENEEFLKTHALIKIPLSPELKKIFRSSDKYEDCYNVSPMQSFIQHLNGQLVQRS